MSISTLHDPDQRAFASDNYAGAHPEVLTALAAANGGHQVAYGDDSYTERLADVIRVHFGERAQTFPVFNGTGANVVALTSVLPRWGAVVTASSAHIHTDEAGAPERMTGLKLLTVPTADGKLTPDLVAREAWGWGDEHRAQPLAVSITQATELGTVYTPDEVRALCEFAHEHGMAVHMDGARLWNAAAALGVGFREFTTDAGVDILSLGGTKNGLLGAEAVVVLDPDGSSGLVFLRKLTMQLASKMRFASAQLLALFEDDLGLRSAAHANAMTQRLRTALEAGIADGTLRGLAFTQDSQANAIFATLPTEVADRIRERVRFYDWDRARGEIRWMTAWDTTPEDVDRFVDIIAEEFARSR
ncbi:threonine aldolase [Mycolicibacterium moriokaense]|uniref:Threonine aldolase n=1 Tax=Mycolicibacterium moriokaense TaxID=39691 RepID=A0AAD1H7N4_9MYCO|nr:low specificity L-threonine aldolase [Mycolicibacterium moriokaense]MCV7039038.1 low specificity L-threonine aldolase [Mycolicibacterium moriokaense]ORB20448.1 threonine aldolase [Mycolicibacterium moriokaense]BBW99938.1 threonine aldolase [Mycolicibacterium moriokaense]